MALVLKSGFQLYQIIFNEKRDTRLDYLPLMGSPWPMISIIISYVYLSKYLGPTLMENRKPYKIKNLITIYNIMQIVWNFFISYYGIYWIIYRGEFNWKCEPIKLGTTLQQKNAAIATYFYFLAKIFDLFDTMFFVLRKKQQHISFLHVYHHTIMVFVSYIAANFLPAGHSSLLGILNSIVHIFMYSYYFLTSFNSDIKYLNWWKKLLTQLQMCQFIILAVHYAQGLLHDCSYPKSAMVIGTLQNGFMFGMFYEFYYNEYIKKKKPNYEPNKLN